MNLTGFVGNEALRSRLAAQEAGGGLHHAYLLSGEPGSGKHTLAGLIAAALVCSGPAGQRPCLTCPHCKKALGGIHPDIVPVRRNGDKRYISVEQVRQMRKNAFVMPNEARRKVFVMEDAHTMNPNAQNALLKVLEEGPDYAAFLLLAENERQLLPTVRSRCELLQLSPVTEEEAAAFLSAQYPDKSPQEIFSAARRCRGNLGRGRELLAGEQGETIPILAGEIVDTVVNGEELRRMELLLPLEKWERGDVALLLSALEEELICRLEEPGVPEEQRRILSADTEQVRRLQQAVESNVSGATLSAWLCAAL